MSDWDVIVVGAGSAGSATALQCARRGLRTLVVEKHALDVAGARWVNGVFARAFDEAEVARPLAPELRAAGHRFHLVAGWGPVAMTLADPGVIDVDMGLLIDRLQAEARAAGATFVDRSAVDGIVPGEVVFRPSDGVRRVERARVVVDATGLGGLFRPEKPVPGDVCAAAQGVYRVVDRAAAHAFFARFEAEPGETVCFAAVAGGYSILAVRLEGEDEVSILSGSLPSHGHASGRALRDDFAAREAAWIGPLQFGGQAPIPLHRPRRELAFVSGHGRAATAVVRIGDAAGQVYAAHGSGVGAQLVASHMLAARVAAEGPAGALAWDKAWHRRFGPAFVAADVLRRASTRLGPRALGLLIRARLVPPAMVRLGMAAGL